MGTASRVQRKAQIDEYDSIKSKLEDMKLDRKVQNDMWSNVCAELFKQIDAIVDYIYYECKFGFDYKTAKELTEILAKLLEKNHKKAKRPANTISARKIKIKFLENFANRLEKQEEELRNYTNQIVKRVSRTSNRFQKAYKSIEESKENLNLDEKKKQEIEELCTKYHKTKGQAESEETSILPSQREEWIKVLEGTTDKLNDIADNLAMEF